MNFNKIILLMIFLLAAQFAYSEEFIKIYYTESSGEPNKKDYFLRKLIDEKKGRYQVQDFYLSGNKKTCPYVLLDRNDLYKDIVKTIDGSYIAFDLTGNQEANVYYKNGKLITATINFYGNGIKRTESYQYNGVLDGPFTAWYYNGTKKISGTFSNGKQVGVFIYWDINGNKSSEIYWKNPGKKSKELQFDKQGNIIKEIKYEDDNKLSETDK